MRACVFVYVCSCVKADERYFIFPRRLYPAIVLAKTFLFKTKDFLTFIGLLIKVLNVSRGSLNFIEIYNALRSDNSLL